MQYTPHYFYDFAGCLLEVKFCLSVLQQKVGRAWEKDAVGLLRELLLQRSVDVQVLVRSKIM